MDKKNVSANFSNLDFLPESWQVKPIEAFAATETGGTPSRKKPSFFGPGYPWVKSGELGDKVVLKTGETITEDGLKNSNAKIFLSGTLLMALYGATTGKVGVLAMNAATNQAICAIIPDKKVVITEYLFYALIHLRPSILKSRYGGAQPNISQTIVRNILVRLPPLPEQRAIAQVLRTVQQAKEATEKVIVATRQLKQSLLRYLLTYGPIPFAQADTVILKDGEYGPVPESWKIAELQKAVDSIAYGLSAAIPKQQPKSGVKIVSTADITKDGRITYNKIRRVEVATRVVHRLTLDSGDVLFNWRNSPELIGKTTIFEAQDEPHIFASFILRIRTGEKKSHNSYLKYLLNQYREMGVFLILARRAVNQANYNRNEISVLKIPLPPLEVQQKIARFVGGVDQKIAYEENRLRCMEALFASLLQNLMTGQIRVHDLDLPPLKEVA